MAWLKLAIESVDLTTEVGLLPSRDGQWRFAGRAKLPIFDRLELGTGESHREIEAFFTFAEESDELTEWTRKKFESDGFGWNENESPRGVLHYIAEYQSKYGIDGHDSSLHFDLYIPRPHLAALIGFAEQGRFPNSLNVEVKGLEYGYAPDGSDTKWLNNKEKPILPITEWRYTIPIIPEGEDEDTTVDQPKTGVGADLAPILKEAVFWIKGAVYVLLALGAFVVFRFK